MDIGKLKHRITIQNLQFVSQDPVTGDEIYDWVTVAQTWAQIQGISGREFLSANAEQAGTTFKIIIRYMKNLLPAYRIVMGEQIFNISAILPDNNKRMTTIMAEMGVNNG